MGLWTKQQLREFIKENNLVTAQDAQNALKELFAETIQEMLEAEIDTHLGYEKHEAKKTPNSRNGRSHKTVVGEYVEQQIAVPRETGWVSLSRWWSKNTNPTLPVLRIKS